MSGKKHGDKRKIDAISEVDEKPKIKREDRIPMVDDKTKMKRSSRNASEKRRRDKLNTYINELSAMVPSCSSPHSSRKLDKSTILKLTVSYMRLHADLLSPSPNESTVSWKPAFLSNEELGTLMLEALDGFLFVITMSGRILFVSHTVAPLLGHLQNYLIGRSLFDITHDEDRECLDSTLKQHFNPQTSDSSSSTGSKAKVSFTIRMLRGGQNINSYELVHCSGHVRRWEDAIKNPSQDGEFTDIGGQGLMLDSEMSPTHCLVAVGKMEAPRIIRDMSSIELGKNEYISRHSLEAKYLFVDTKGPSIIGYLPSEIIGSSAYDFYHIDDLSILSVNHKNLMNHGNSVTMFYRFLTKGQQWIWLQTHGYVEYNKWTKKPETIICHNVVVSYSKVLEYLQTRALEYGPGMPPVDPSRSPTDIIIGALCPDGRKAPMLLGEDRISDVTPGINTPGINTQGINTQGINTQGINTQGINTPGINKEEPPSPPVGSVLNCPASIPAIPVNLYPAQGQVLYRNEIPPKPSQQEHQQYNKMEVDSHSMSSGSQQNMIITLEQQQHHQHHEPHQLQHSRQSSPGKSNHLQHIDLQRSQMLNIHPPQQQHTQHVLSPPPHPQHQHHQQHMQQQHSNHSNQQQNQQCVTIQQQQPSSHQPESQARLVQISQHVNIAPQTPQQHQIHNIHDAQQPPRQTLNPQINLQPQTPQQILIQPMTPQQIQQQPNQHVQQHVQQSTQHVQQPTQHVQQPAQHVQQPTQHVQQSTQHVQQPTQHVQQSTLHVQQPTQHVQQPTQHVQQPTQQVQQPTQHVQQSTLHVQQQQQPCQQPSSQYLNNQPPTPQQHSVQQQHVPVQVQQHVGSQQPQQHQEPQQHPQSKQHHPSVQQQQQHVPAHKQHQQPSHTVQQPQQHVTQQITQLRPQINLQGMQYMARPVGSLLSPTIPQNGTIINQKSDTGVQGQRMCSPQQQQTSQTCQQQRNQNCQQQQQQSHAPSQRASHEAPQYSGTQQSPQFVIPTTDTNIGHGSTNVIVIQQPGSDQYQFAQLYPIIHSVTSGATQQVNVSTNSNTMGHKLSHTTTNGSYEASKNNYYPQNAQVSQSVKQETTRCIKTGPQNVQQDKTIFRNINQIFDQSEHGSTDHVLDTIDPEYISMILSNTNIDNIMDSQWNNMLFDTPPKTSHNMVSDNSSNPSPISSHSPGT